MEASAIRRRVREMIATGALPCEDPENICGRPWRRQAVRWMRGAHHLGRYRIRGEAHLVWNKKPASQYCDPSSHFGNGDLIYVFKHR
jgi:hypothetical protein